MRKHKGQQRVLRLLIQFTVDGDTISFNSVVTKESVKEIDNLLASKSFYITPDGKLTYSAETDTLNYVLKHLSKQYSNDKGDYRPIVLLLLSLFR